MRRRSGRGDAHAAMESVLYGIVWLLVGLVAGFALGGRMAHADDEFMYRLGGAEPISVGAADRSRTRTFGVSGAWDADLMCGRFDVAHSIGNQLNGVTGAFQTVMGDVVSTAQGVVASLPMLAIQRLNPGLYDLLQNGVLEASQEFRMARMRCEEVTRDMGETLLHEGWAGVARRDYWRRQAGLGADILETSDEAESEGGDEGVPWVGGEQAGGAGQPPIRTGPDAAKAGMNALLGRRTDDSSPVDPGVCAGARICQVWESPAAIDAWVVQVLGETEIRTCEGCEKVRAKAGEGLASVYRNHLAAYSAVLMAEVRSREVPSQASLEKLSEAGAFVVTRRVIEAVREEERPEAVARRIAGELALARTVDEGLLLRRALWAGIREPNVANSGMALAGVMQVIDELDSDLAGMEREMRMRAAATGNTTAAVLRRQAQRRMAAVPVDTDPEVRLLGEGGAVE